MFCRSRRQSPEDLRSGSVGSSVEAFGRASSLECMRSHRTHTHMRHDENSCRGDNGSCPSSPDRPGMTLHTPSLSSADSPVVCCCSTGTFEALAIPLLAEGVPSKGSRAVPPWPPSPGARDEASAAPPPVRRLSPLEASFSLSNCVIGIGILAVPYAFKLGGLVTGAVCAVLCVLYCYTGLLIGRLLARCEQKANFLGIPPERRDWQWLGRCAFGRVGEEVAFFALCGELFFVVVSYMATAGKNVCAIIPGMPVSPELVILLCGVATFALLFASQRLISWVSLVANVSAAGVVVALVYSTINVTDKPSYDELKILDLREMPSAIGIINFCFVAHAIFPSIYNNMENPSRRFALPLATSYVAALVFYVTAGLVGYIGYGDSIEDPFTLNIGRDIDGSRLPGFICRVFPTFANALITIKLMSQLPILTASLTEAAEKRWRSVPATGAGAVVTRLFLTGTLTLLAAACHDALATLQSLTGCLFVMLTCVILPAAFALKIEMPALEVRVSAAAATTPPAKVASSRNGSPRTPPGRGGDSSDRRMHIGGSDRRVVCVWDSRYREC
eukprot:Polyplicarium_translucidae@DN3049_c0_g1_i3.p1